MQELSFIQSLVVFVIPAIFAITVHEAAHGWVAEKLGDRTARMLGRITLNPIPHIDLIGTILLPFGLYAMALLAGTTPLLFGWAKPVPIDLRNVGNIRRDSALIAAAGPLSNFFMLLLWALLIRIGFVVGDSAAMVSVPLIYMGVAGIFINAILMVINLIPILPLDGGRVLSSLLPPRMAYAFSRLEPWGIMILLALLLTGLLRPILIPALGLVQGIGFTIAGMN